MKQRGLVVILENDMDKRMPLGVSEPAWRSCWSPAQSVGGCTIDEADHHSEVVWQSAHQNHEKLIHRETCVVLRNEHPPNDRRILVSIKHTTSFSSPAGRSKLRGLLRRELAYCDMAGTIR